MYDKNKLLDKNFLNKLTSLLTKQQKEILKNGGSSKFYPPSEYCKINILLLLFGFLLLTYAVIDPATLADKTAMFVFNVLSLFMMGGIFVNLVLYFVCVKKIDEKYKNDLKVNVLDFLLLNKNQMTQKEYSFLYNLGKEEDFLSKPIVDFIHKLKEYLVLYNKKIKETIEKKRLEAERIMKEDEINKKKILVEIGLLK